MRKAQKEEIDKAIQQLLDDGMSMEQILEKLSCGNISNQKLIHGKLQRMKEGI